jgi:hypothetical protein
MATALAAWPAAARAAGDDGDAPAPASGIDPAGPHALGRVLTAGQPATGLTLLSAGGYGYTESVLGIGDAHHRAAGALTLDARVVPWLAFALRLDGRYDAHTVPGLATDTGLVGDPRVYARVDGAWASGLRLGARAGLWLPGHDAPSVELDALSPELVGVASYVPRSAAIALTANVGYRFDRSARSAPEAARLSRSDRLALGVSAFDQVLVGVAATIGRGRAQGFVEAGADLLVGAGAPSAGRSPIRIGAGGRFALGRSLRLEAAVEASPGGRPDTSPTAPLVPVPPRFSAWLGLAYHFGGPPPAAVPGPTPPDAPTPEPEPEPGSPSPTPAALVLAGRVSAADGGQLTALRVEVTAGDARRDISTDEQGRFKIEGEPGQELTVSAEAAGYAPARSTVTLAAGAANELEIALERRAPKGQIRGLVRSLRGAAIAAEISVEPEAAATPSGTARDAKQLRAEGGRFEIDVAPGRYQITISAPGYEVQRRRVDVEENGVTVLNVDLRKGR